MQVENPSAVIPSQTIQPTGQEEAGRKGKPPRYAGVDPQAIIPIPDATARFLLDFSRHIIVAIFDPEIEKKKPGAKIPPVRSAPTGKVDMALQGQGYGLYFTPNGIRGNEDQDPKRTANDLAAINCFFVDVDAPKTGAEESEKEKMDRIRAFKEMALENVAHESLYGFPPTYIVETKNGYHLYWCLKRPIVLDSLTTIQRDENGFEKTVRDEPRIGNLIRSCAGIETALIRRFHGDKSAKDMTRLLRVPGTWHLKEADDPFRIKIIQSNPGARYSYKEIKEYALQTNTAFLRNMEEAQGAKDRDAETVAEFVAAGKRYSEIPKRILLDLESRYPKYGRSSLQAIIQGSSIPEGERNASLFIAASTLRESGETEASVLARYPTYSGLDATEIERTVHSAFARSTPADFGWNHPLIQRHVTETERLKVGAILASLLAEEYRKEREKKPGAKDDASSLDPETIQAKEKINAMKALPEDARDALTRSQKRIDANLQKKVFEKFEYIIREAHPYLKYVHSFGFVEYQEGVYVERPPKEMESLVLRQMEDEGLTMFRTVAKVKDKLACLASIIPTVVSLDEFDADPNILNLMDGLYDISSGMLEPHTPEKLSLLQLPIKIPQGEAAEATDCPTFKRFVSEIMRHDEKKILLLQEIAGYCLTKSTMFQKAFIFHGNGANGKSTFLDCLQTVLGPKNASSLTIQNMSSPFGLAGLHKKRLNVVEEISSNYFESDMIKKIITGASITCDRKYQEPFIFRPCAKIIFAANTLPKIRDVSKGLYRRFMVVPFIAEFLDHPDLRLPERLRDETAGIFLWMIDGLKRLLMQDGFTETPEVLQAATDFKEQNSALVEFFLSMTDVAIGAAVSAKTAYLHYKNYCRDFGYQSKSLVQFFKEIETFTHPGLPHVKITKNDKEMKILNISLPAFPISEDGVPFV